jgi:imidazolonepropionase-like amidohydrolase
MQCSKSAVLAVLFLCPAAFGAPAQEAAPKQPVIIVHAGWLLAKPGVAPVKKNQSIVIRNGRIGEIRDGFVRESEVGGTADGVTVIDLADSFVLPGLIDTHVHLAANVVPEEGWQPSNTLDYVVKTDADWALTILANARVTLESGFTTVRDLGEPEPSKAIFAVRRAIAAGIVSGPRILACGAAITETGGVADWMPFRPEVRAAFADRAAICNGADNCRRAARNELRNGAEVLKVYLTGGEVDLIDPERGDTQPMFDDEVKAIVDVAHKMNKRVAAHVLGEKGFSQAVRLGVDSVEHGDGMTDELIRLMKQKGIFLVPTLASEDPALLPPKFHTKGIQDFLRKHGEMTRRAHAAGVKIAFGSDTGELQHGHNWQEFIGLSKVGFSPTEAIGAATVISAELLGLSAEIGTIEPGKAADIVATKASPLDDLHELARVIFVMKGGEVIKAPKRSATVAPTEPKGS